MTAKNFIFLAAFLMYSHIARSQTWNERFSRAIRIAERYNCMPNTIEPAGELNPAEKAEVEEIAFMAIMLANMHADDALRLVDHRCPTVRVYALLALRSWGSEYYTKDIIKHIPKPEQINVCHHDKTDNITPNGDPRSWLKGAIKEFHEIPEPAIMLNDPGLLKQIVPKAEAFALNYAQSPDSYISLNETTPAYPRCWNYTSNEGIKLYILEILCFLNDNSGTQNKLVLQFEFDESLVISPRLPFSSNYSRNLTKEEYDIFNPPPPESMPPEMPRE